MSRTFDITHALVTLAPGAKWVHRGVGGYEGLEWLDSSIPPTEEEIQTEIIRLQAEYDALEYKRLRAKEYPSFADQFDLLYHGGYDAWKASIDNIKTKYPKP